ncbi:MAG: molybdopterin oxidoreductase family protein, partial [Chloroflexi bacterium]
ARRYAAARPALIKISDGLQRHLNGGQTVRAVCALPALTGQVGVRGGGLAYSASGYALWDDAVLNKWQFCPPPGRVINMNRLGAALTGEAQNPPVMSLVVFGANPVTSAPNAGKIVAGLRRDDLFTVVHELFLTDTARFADILLPATSQLEQTDLHKAYGHTCLTYNHPAIAPLGQSKSNWDVMRLLAQKMGFDDDWLRQSADEVIAEMLDAMAAAHPQFAGISLERVQTEPFVPLDIENPTPFANLNFPTPSGKIELYSQTLADAGLDPLPGWIAPVDNCPPPQPVGEPLALISGAAHHFTSSSFANQPELLRREGTPFVEIHPADAAARGIAPGDIVTVENGRGACRLRAVVTDGVRPGVLVSPKGRWASLDPFRNGGEGRNVNWTTSDALGDMAGQSTFHSNRVWLRKSADGA